MINKDLYDENNILKFFKDTLKNINTISNKWIILFWFLGPFIYLIERSPGDMWLSIIAILFLVRSYRMKDWSWTSQIWFKFALIYWIWGLLTALQGPMPELSFQEGFVWIRFPLYAAAVQTWIACNREIRASMIFLISIAAFIMSCILFGEYFWIYFENNAFFDGRLTWPYGDHMPGNFIAKTCMPALIVLVAIYTSRINIKNSFYLLCVLFSIIAVLITGERTSLLLSLCSCVVAFIIMNFNFKTFTYLSLIMLFLLSLALLYDSSDPIPINGYISDPLSNNNRIFNRYTDELLSNIPILNTDTSYWGTWRSGLQQGLENFWLGVGPTGSRHTCGLLGQHWLPGENYCGNHPHNFYIQMFAETGFIGLIIGIIMIFHIFRTCWISKRNLPQCFMARTAFIIPLAMFFPFQQTGSFFGQWNNLFMWFALGFALSNYQKWKKK